MSDYVAPLADMRFALSEIAGLRDIAQLPGFEQATPDLVDAVLEEAGKLSGDVLGPLNRVGDLQGSKLENGVVRTPPGSMRRIGPERSPTYVDPSGPNASPVGTPRLVATAADRPSISTRYSVPSNRSVTYSAPSGPMAIEVGWAIVVTKGSRARSE